MNAETSHPRHVAAGCQAVSPWSGHASRPAKRGLTLALALLLPCVSIPWPSTAADLELLSVGLRTRVGEKRVLGQEAPQSFRAHDAVAQLQLPWQYEGASGWGMAVGTGLMSSAGVMQGAGKTAWVVSAVPVLTVGPRNDLFTLDLGAGLALISRHRFANQDFGGHLQGALTLGVTVPLWQRFSLGYRFQHYSDAGWYGPATIGVDFHMIEFSYRL